MTLNQLYTFAVQINLIIVDLFIASVAGSEAKIIELLTSDYYLLHPISVKSSVPVACLQALVLEARRKGKTPQ